MTHVLPSFEVDEEKDVAVIQAIDVPVGRVSVKMVVGCP